MQDEGNFEIVREIGRGGMAVVYLARQGSLDRNVALKQLHAPGGDPTFADRFLREAQMAAGLGHANIVTVYEYFERHGSAFIAMEYVHRGSLRPLVGGLSLAQTAGALEGILAGLAYAASCGIAHRDLKPENLMVTDQGTVKIADFGIARAYNQVASKRLTDTGIALGTPTYMAPEQALGRDLGPWTDLYSTGVIAYELLVGQVPFEADDTPLALLMRHVSEPVPPPLEIRPDLDPRLAGWLDRMLAKDPAERYCGAYLAWEDLEDIVLEVLGPRWRREARIVDSAATDALTAPLTPAAFGDEATPTVEEPPKGPAAGYATYGSSASTPRAPEPPPAEPPAEPAPNIVVAGPPAPEPTPAPDPTPAPVSTPATGRVAQFEFSDGRHSRRRRLILACAVIVATALGIGAAVELTGGGSSAASSRAGGRSTTQTTATITDTGTTATTVPADYVPLQASTFSIRYPPGWTVGSREVDKGGYTDTTVSGPSGGHTGIKVDVSPGGSGDPMAHAQLVRSLTSGSAGYQSLGFAQAAGNVRWRFIVASSTEPGVVLERVDVFRTQNGHTYAILGQAPPDEFAAFEPTFESVLASFKPA